MSNQEYAGTFASNATVTEYQDKFICKLGREGSIVVFYKLIIDLLNFKKSISVSCESIPEWFLT